MVVTEDGTAILVWRSNYEVVNWSNPDEGWIYYSTKDLKTDSDWTEPRKVSLVRAGLLEFFSSLALVDKDTATYTYRNLTGPLDNPTEVMEVVFIELKPDLVISDVLVEDTKILSETEGVPVQISAMLSNLGDIDAGDVNVSFYDGDPDTGGELIDSIVFTNVPRLGSEIVSINWGVEQVIHDIHVVVDPNNSIVEHEEGNNRGYCTVNCLPDLKIEPADISFSSTTPNVGQEIQITADVHNIGYTSADNVQVNFYDGDPNKGGTLITTEYIVFIGIDQTGQAIVNWAARGGNHDIYVEVIDADDMDLTNNLASDSISILPDLSVEVGDFTVSESELLENEEVTLSATIHNIGGANVSYVIVKFYTADQFIGYDIVNVSINGIIDNTATVSLDWTPPVGVHLIYVKVDPGNQIKELNEANNIQQTMVSVLRSLDLSVDLQLDETEPGKILITADIPNNGNGDASNVNVEFYDGEPGLGGVLINSTTIDKIEGHGSTGVTFDWETTSGRKTVYAVVDGMDIIPETDETNNVQSKSVQVGGEKEDDGNPLLLILLIIVIIAVPVVLIIFWWRRRLIH